MRRPVRRCQPPSDQGREEVIHFLSADDTGVGAVLPAHAHSGMQHDGYQEGGLATREALFLHSIDALLWRHDKNSSARRGSTPRPLRPEPLTPPTRAPTARYRENPARTFAAAWAPR